MGYLTTYTTNLLSGDEQEYNKVLTAIKDKYGIDFLSDNVQDVKWYNYEKDLIRLTKKYPGLTIELCGDGENSDDNWTARFHDGNVEYEKGSDFGFFEIASNKERDSFLGNIEKAARNNLLDFITYFVRKEKGPVEITLNTEPLKLSISDGEELIIKYDILGTVKTENIGIDILLVIAHQLNKKNDKQP